MCNVVANPNITLRNSWWARIRRALGLSGSYIIKIAVDPIQRLKQAIESEDTKGLSIIPFAEQ